MSLSPIDLVHRQALELVRARVAEAVARAYRETIDEADIVVSFAEFTKVVEPLIAAGQSVAQILASNYIATLIGSADVPELADVVGTTAAGKALAEALDPFPSMMLGAIANGASPQEALAYGQALVTGFSDREVTAASDRETEAQVAEGGWQWEGIVQAGSCEPCRANAGVHDAADPIYRHNDCNCDRTWIPPSTGR